MPPLPGRRAVPAPATAELKYGRSGQCEQSQAMQRSEARDPDETAGAVARRSYGKLVAYLASRTRDVAAAEDALSDAFARALADWPKRGVPDNPEAWLLTVARRTLIDAARHGHVGQAAEPHLRLLAEESGA